MSRVITVTQVHFQACKWFAICWLSYANVPCGVLTSWGGEAQWVRAVARRGWNKVKTPGCGFFSLNERSWKTFSAPDYHQLRLPVTFLLLLLPPFFWISVELWRGAHFFFTHPQSINERKLFLDVFQLPTRETVASVVNSPRRTPRPPPLHLSRKRAFITPAPCLISDTANVTSNHQTLCARGTITGARLSPWQTSQAARPGGGEEKAIM